MLSSLGSTYMYECGSAPGGLCSIVPSGGNCRLRLASGNASPRQLLRELIDDRLRRVVRIELAELLKQLPRGRPISGIARDMHERHEVSAAHRSEFRISAQPLAHDVERFAGCALR